MQSMTALGTPVAVDHRSFLFEPSTAGGWCSVLFVGSFVVGFGLAALAVRPTVSADIERAGLAICHGISVEAQTNAITVSLEILERD